MKWTVKNFVNSSLPFDIGCIKRKVLIPDWYGIENVRYSLIKAIDIKSMITKTRFEYRKLIIVAFVSNQFSYIISKQKQIHIISSYKFIRQSDSS